MALPRSYRGDIKHFAERVSLQDVLNDKLSEQQVKDKIVIIGIDSEFSAPDIVFTPFGQMSGSIVQAQMVSQLVSAVLDKRPLLWWWPIWADVLWIGIWSAIGGLLVWRVGHPLYWAISGVALVSLGGICYVVFAYQSGWIPLVPAIVALVGTTGVVVFKTVKLRQGGSKKRVNRAKRSGLITLKN
ncbi:MAG: CHASE2 domain-containing protein [Stenomitos frigidus ULC029]